MPCSLGPVRLVMGCLYWKQQGQERPKRICTLRVARGGRCAVNSLGPRLQLAFSSSRLPRGDTRRNNGVVSDATRVSLSLASCF